MTIEPCWHGVVGPPELASFYQAVLGFSPLVDPVRSGATGWVFGLRGEAERLAEASQSAGGTLGEGEIRSPSGIPLQVSDAEHASAFARQGPGSIGWTELRTPDEPADLAWLEALGVTSEALPASGDPYHLLHLNGRVIAGCTTATTMIGWLAWVEVRDAERAAAALDEHGGTRCGPLRQLEGVGRMLAARDPSGFLFGMVQPAEGA